MIDGWQPRENGYLWNVLCPYSNFSEVIQGLPNLYLSTDNITGMSLNIFIHSRSIGGTRFHEKARNVPVLFP